MTNVPDLAGFEAQSFDALGTERVVYRRGSGPGVLVMHEAPGITPEVAGFALKVADAGYSVALPVLFGVPGKPLSPAYVLSSLTRACISREFHVLASHRSSPITNWLRALARELHAEVGGPGIGAIGMCLTGNFALALMMEPCLLAPVLSQPSLPFGLTPKMNAALHVSPEELANAKARSAQGVTVLGLRFTGDPLCKGARFETLRREFGAGFEGIEIDSTPGNPDGIGRTAHSVVTTDLVDEAGHPTKEAYDRVMSLFEERLRADA